MQNINAKCQVLSIVCVSGDISSTSLVIVCRNVNASQVVFTLSVATRASGEQRQDQLGSQANDVLFRMGSQADLFIPLVPFSPFPSVPPIPAGFIYTSLLFKIRDGRHYNGRKEQEGKKGGEQFP